MKTRHALVALLSVSTTVLATSTARTQAVAVAPTFTVAPQLRTRLAATKKKADPQVLAATNVMLNGAPALKLKNGRTVPLMTLRAMPPLSPATRAKTTVPPEMAKYKPYVDTMTFEPLKDTPTLVILAVDHTSRQTAIRDQGGRGTCAGFATAAGIESVLKWKTGSTPNLSEQHLYAKMKATIGRTCNDYGAWYTEAIDALLTSTSSRLCSEMQQPYPSQSADCTIAPACIAGANVSVGSIAYLGRQEEGGASQSVVNTRLLEAYLTEGYDVSYAMRMAGTDFAGDAASSGVVDVQLDAAGAPVVPHGAHAMLLVGYNRPAGYFLFRNSWGTDFGRQGYVRVSYDYVQTYGLEAIVITSASVSQVTVAPAGNRPQTVSGAPVMR